eukprot:TRINITY_DN676_c0_g1_i1.p1 TRINITY_DN676_c0_g1~~TRINITY_DN676_c0_g1_i1.p1  ORF type:complete len:658 (-),score=180.90 TRINITY_DN676_c0_g1_i1:210-2000(-)
MDIMEEIDALKVPAAKAQAKKDDGRRGRVGDKPDLTVIFPEHSGTCIDEYKMGKELGHGAFGCVYLAHHKKSKQEVAIKVLNKRHIRSRGALLAIKRECHIMMILQHPNIVRLFNVAETPIQLFFIMEVVKGGDLQEYLNGKVFGRLSGKEALRIFKQTVSAVSFAHKNGVIHRDLKPANIMLDAHRNVKLGDWGLAREFLDDDHVHQMSFCGTPGFAAPELWGREKYKGPEVDVWSAGCILYRMLVGYHPFETFQLDWRKGKGGATQDLLEGHYKTSGHLKFKVNLTEEPDDDAVKRFLKGLTGHESDNEVTVDVEPLIKSMLKADPKKRAKVEEICADPLLWLDWLSKDELQLLADASTQRLLPTKANINAKTEGDSMTTYLPEFDLKGTPADLHGRWRIVKEKSESCEPLLQGKGMNFFKRKFIAGQTQTLDVVQTQLGCAVITQWGRHHKMRMHFVYGEHFDIPPEQLDTRNLNYARVFWDADVLVMEVRPTPFQDSIPEGMSTTPTSANTSTTVTDSVESLSIDESPKPGSRTSKTGSRTEKGKPVKDWTLFWRLFVDADGLLHMDVSGVGPHGPISNKRVFEKRSDDDTN